MKALVVDDSEEIIHSLRLCFEYRWPDTQLVSCGLGAKAIELVETESPDIIILDLGLPDMSGTDVLDAIRRFSDTPVIILSVRNEEMEKVSCLEAGADDYITKPFSPLDILARMRAVLRRRQHVQLAETKSRFEIGNLMVDYASHQILIDQKSVPLTLTEYNLLCYLISNRNRVVSHQAILGEVWGEGYDNEDTIKTYVSQLRRKLGEAGGNPDMIVSVRGVGYKLVSSP